jgi:uncharacterized lipoprotein YehR (DUF1307 family)
MKIINSIQARKMLIALLLVGATHIAMGSFTGSSEDKTKGIYSLKNFNKTFYKSNNPFSIRSGYQYKGTEVLSQKKDTNGITFNSVLRFEKGNTTYVYPYKHHIAVSKFKTPTPPAIR